LITLDMQLPLHEVRPEIPRKSARERRRPERAADLAAPAAVSRGLPFVPFVPFVADSVGKAQSFSQY
jgi:hypothetical protein